MTSSPAPAQPSAGALAHAATESSLPLGDPPPTPTADDGSVDWIVNVTIAQATTRTERRFACLRIGFCLLSLSVFLLHLVRYPAEVDPRQVYLEVSLAALGVCLSAWVLRRTRERLIGERLKVLAAALDAGLVVFALGGNQLSPGYAGLLLSLDVAIAPLFILTSVLRVSPRAVLSSSVVLTAGVAGLLALDAHRGLPVAPKLPLYAMYHAAAILLSYFFTARAREIFGRVGQVALRAEGARRSVRALLEDHHDLRSVLCDLQLGADRLHEALSSGQEPARVATLERALAAGIASLTKGAETTRDRALLALEGAGQPSLANVRRAVDLAQHELERLAPALELRVAYGPTEAPVLFGGGTSALSRLLLHLLVNAKEGDGQRGASRVVVTTRQRRGAVDIDIQDDGPGFAPALLGKLGRDRGYTTKRGSSGIGLWLAHSSLLAAGGSLLLINDGGARVRVTLRAAP